MQFGKAPKYILTLQEESRPFLWRSSEGWTPWTFLN
jgi:hypothetical protein